MKKSALVMDRKSQRTDSIPPSHAQTKGWISNLETMYLGRAETSTFRKERPILRLYLKRLREVLNLKYGSRFELREPFAVGRTGILFGAADADMPGDLVLKFNRYLPPESMSMVDNERQVLPLLNHPNIIRVIETGVAGVKVMKSTHRLSYIIEPLVPDALPLGLYVEKFLPNQAGYGHELLDDYLKSLIKLLCQWLGALNYIHHQGFIHLDVKPDNAIVDKNGRLLVVDFGSAKRFNKEELRFRSEARRDLTRDFADSSCASEADTQLQRRPIDESRTNAFFTKRYAHPYLRELRRRSFANRPAALIERSLLHPRFDYYALGKSILELLNTIAERNTKDCSSSPLFQSLHLLATRLLDGCNELSPDSEDIAGEIWGDLRPNNYGRIRYRDLETVIDDLERELET